MIKQEWKRLFKNPILLLVLIVIMSIPAMYAGLFLSSMWDPYGDLDKLPVAVVNLDKEVEFKDGTLNVGETLVDNLKENGSLDFHFVNQQDAENGLKDGTYYMVITIPEDFSYKASTAVDYQPEKMQLLYKTNPATNYVATKLSQSAMNKIELSLQESVSKSYIDALMTSLKDVGTGLGDAADGVSKIYDGQIAVEDAVDSIAQGTSSIKDGADTLNTGASDLNDGAVALSEGASTLSDGATTLYNGTTSLKDGASTLYDGSVVFESGLNSYLDGTTALQTGINSMYDNMPMFVNGISSIDTGASSLVEGNKLIITGYEGVEGQGGLLNGSANLAAGAGTLDSMVQNADTTPLITISEEQMTTLGTGAASLASASITSDNQLVKLVAAGIMAQYAQNGMTIDAETANAYAVTYVQQLASSVASSTATGTASTILSNVNSSLPGTLGVYTAQLSSGATALDAGINQMYNGSLAIQSGLEDLSAGTTTLSTGATTIGDGVTALNNGANALVANNETLSAGAGSIVSGSNSLSNGASALNDGASNLSEGASALSEGATTLATGTSTLYEGTTALYEGAVTLDDGVGDLQDALPDLSDGSSTLYTSLNDGATEISDTNLEDANSTMMSNPVDTVETQITTVDNNGSAMAAYMMSVGLWVACLAFCLMYPLTEHENLKNGFAWWASKASVLFPIAVVQGVALVVVLNKCLGLNPVDMKGTVFVAILSSIAFMAIMYFFNAFIGKVGSFIMLVFMVFQLAGSAGTYPIELSGPLAQALHKFVPFTYTVNAFRSTIGGGESYTSAIVVLVAIIIVFSVLTLWMFQARSLSEKHGKANVHDYLEAKGLA